MTDMDAGKTPGQMDSLTAMIPDQDGGPLFEALRDGLSDFDQSQLNMHQLKNARLLLKHLVSEAELAGNVELDESQGVDLCITNARLGLVEGLKELAGKGFSLAHVDDAAEVEQLKGELGKIFSSINDEISGSGTAGLEGFSTAPAASAQGDNAATLRWQIVLYSLTLFQVRMANLRVSEKAHVDKLEKISTRAKRKLDRLFKRIFKNQKTEVEAYQLARTNSATHRKKRSVRI